MPSISESRAVAEKKLADGKWAYTNLAPPPAVLPPTSAYPAAPNQYLRGPLPPDMWEQPDAQRQFHAPAIPQVRVAPLPDNTNAVVGASGQSQAIPVSSVVAATARSTTLSAVSNALPGTVTNDTVSAATQDNVTDGTVYTRTSQMVSSAVVVDNANFEASATILPPPGWANYVNVASVTYDTLTQFSGKQSIKITANSSAAPGNAGGIVTIKNYAVRVGEVYRINAQAKLISGAGVAAIAFTFRDANGTDLLDALASTSSGSWTPISASAIGPAGSVYATIELFLTGANAVGEFDEVKVARMQTAFEVTPINTAGTPTSTTGLCAQHSAGSTQIDVSSSTWQFGDGQVSYNSGTANPGVLGTYYVYADDPGFNGGAVTYVATTTPSDSNAANGRMFFGKIVLAAGTATSTGGGSGGGGPISKASLL